MKKITTNIRNVQESENVYDSKLYKLGFFQGKSVIMAGPCAIEGYEQFYETVKFLHSLGVKIVRAGLFKPRSHPDSFQGLGKDGIDILESIRKEFDVCFISEVLDEDSLDLLKDIVEIVQVGSRNMYNYSLLKSLAKLKKPVLLKRGFMSTLKEWLGAAEYLIRGGSSVILCERGIRTFDTETRFTLDAGIIPVVKIKTQFPLIVDPSHSSGNARYVTRLACAGIAAGADGLLVEVHRDPPSALSDGKQSISHSEFKKLLNLIKGLDDVLHRE